MILGFAWLTAPVSRLQFPFFPQVKERKGPPTYHTDLYKPQEMLPPKGLA